jgi:hypothetical protein
VDIVPLFFKLAAVDVLNMTTALPLVPKGASFETVTPALIVTSAPVSRVRPLTFPPAQLELTTTVDVIVTPPLHCAIKILWEIKPPRIVVHVRNRTKYLRILVFYVCLREQFRELALKLVSL